SPHQMGIGYPVADSLIEERIEECETNASACETSHPDPLTNGTYYYNTSLTGDLDINTSEGDVVLVVNGSFTPGTVNVSGSRNVTVFINGDFAFGGIDTINYGGDAVAFTAIVHSSGDVDMNGAFRYVGFVYAPGSDVDLNGGGPPWFVNVRGGIVGKTIDINGHPNKFEYDDSISDIQIDTETGLSTITYLHVSSTTINVTGPR
ncbi:MAG: hypothetical protein R3324_06610, partial [Halobacteriales archaeon]|nr:hypothetical protein [Halobacteriales archaeon]